MKTILGIILVLCVAAGVHASGVGGAAFPLFSSASAGTVVTPPFNVRGYKHKSMIITGATLASNATTAVYKNFSGTVIAQCSADNVVWATCNQSQLASTPAVSQANTQSAAATAILMTWQDSVAYVRLKWTAAGTACGKVKAWLNWTE